MNDDDARTAAAELLTLEEAEADPRTPVATLRYWRHLGVGPDGFRLGRRVVYRRHDVDRWVAERRQAQSPPSVNRSPVQVSSGEPASRRLPGPGPG